MRVYLYADMLFCTKKGMIQHISLAKLHNNRGKKINSQMSALFLNLSA